MQKLDILATLALRGVLEEIAQQYPRQAGVELALSYGATKSLQESIRQGARADVTLLTREAVAELQAEGVLLPGIPGDVAGSDIGVAVRQGAPLPDISTVESFKATLLSARSIVYSDVGASGIYFKGLLERLGIAQAVNAKARILPPGLNGELVARGEVELAIQQVSELMQVSGIAMVGLLPVEIRQTTVFTAGVFAGSPRVPAARAFVEHLRSSTALLTSKGLRPATQL